MEQNFFYERRKIWNNASSLSSKIESISLDAKKIGEVDSLQEQQALLDEVKIEKKKNHKALVLLQEKINTHFSAKILGTKKTEEGISSSIYSIKKPSQSEIHQTALAKIDHNTQDQIDDLTEEYSIDGKKKFWSIDHLEENKNGTIAAKVGELKQLTITIHKLERSLSSGLFIEKDGRGVRLSNARRTEIGNTLVTKKNEHAEISSDITTLLKQQLKNDQDTVVGKHTLITEQQLSTLQAKASHLKDAIKTGYLDENATISDVPAEIKKYKNIQKEWFGNDIPYLPQDKKLFPDESALQKFLKKNAQEGRWPKEKEDQNQMLLSTNAALKVIALQKLQKKLSQDTTAESKPTDTLKNKAKTDTATNKQETAKKISSKETSFRDILTDDQYKAKAKEIFTENFNLENASIKDIQQKLNEYIKIEGIVISWQTDTNPLKEDGLLGIRTTIALKTVYGIERTPEEQKIEIYERRASFNGKNIDYEFITRGDRVGDDKLTTNEDASKAIRFKRSAENAFASIEKSRLIKEFKDLGLEISKDDLRVAKDNNEQKKYAGLKSDGYILVWKLQNFFNTSKAKNFITQWTSDTEARAQVSTLLTDGRWGKNTDRVFRMFLSHFTSAKRGPQEKDTKEL